MTIRSDRGKQFVNAIISQLLSLLQIEHELSLAYSKVHNAIVERANKEVLHHLTAIIFDKQANVAWSSEYLPRVQRIIMNVKVHDTIGVSPAELLYGKAINLYTGLLSSFPPESLVKGQEEAANGRLSDHIAKLIAMQALLIEVARDKQLGTDSFHMMGSSRNGDAFLVNSYVPYRPPDGSRTKLQMLKAGRSLYCGWRCRRSILHTGLANTQSYRYTCI
jgi:transposase InsO family protein